MITEFKVDLHSQYPKGSLWKDSSSYKKEDNKNDYYMRFEEWKFIGRYEDCIKALEGSASYDN